MAMQHRSLPLHRLDSTRWCLNQILIAPGGVQIKFFSMTFLSKIKISDLDYLLEKQIQFSDSDYSVGGAILKRGAILKKTRHLLLKPY
jgi:hypothetical protein